MRGREKDQQGERKRERRRERKEEGTRILKKNLLVLTLSVLQNLVCFYIIIRFLVISSYIIFFFFFSTLSENLEVFTF